MEPKVALTEEAYFSGFCDMKFALNLNEPVFAGTADLDSGPQHAPAFQRLDHVAVVAGTVIAVAGLLEVALDRLRLIPGLSEY